MKWCDRRKMFIVRVYQRLRAVIVLVYVVSEYIYLVSCIYYSKCGVKFARELHNLRGKNHWSLKEAAL